MIDNNFMLSILGKTDKKIFSVQFMIAAKINYKIMKCIDDEIINANCFLIL